MNPYTAAQTHFSRAFAFYDDHGQGESALGELTAGLVALSAQLARIELAVIGCHEA